MLNGLLCRSVLSLLGLLILGDVWVGMAELLWFVALLGLLFGLVCCFLWFVALIWVGLWSDLMFLGLV